MSSDRERTIKAYAEAARGWARWEAEFVAFTWPVTLRLVQRLGLSAGHRVLDIGCGTGEPALAIASVVGPDGRVRATDLTPEMLAVARERAKVLRIENVEFEQAAIEELGPPAKPYDAVVSRWGVIFCRDVAAELRRIRGWLKPGGRIALATWTPMENSPGFQLVNDAVTKLLDLPPPDPDEPGMQNVSRPGQLAEVLTAAGYRDVGAELVPLMCVVRDGREYWEMSLDTGATLRAVLKRLSAAQHDELGRRMAEAAERFRVGEVLRIPALAQVGWAAA